MVEMSNATRSELIRLKQRIKLAWSGYDLLKRKLDALVSEFMRTIGEEREKRKKFNQIFDAAKKKIMIAKVYDGMFGIKIASLACERAVKITVTSKNIMGVKVPNIQQVITGETIGYDRLSTSVKIDDAAEAFEELLDAVIDLATVEVLVKRTLDEIIRTRRRVNSLKYKTIPELERMASFISASLDETERVNFFSLKRAVKMA